MTAVAVAGPAMAHGFAGTRFFPATIATDDPAVADELSLPTLSHLDSETEVSGEYSKRITRTFGFSVEGAWTHDRDGGVSTDGFQNVEATVKWQFLTNAAHETILAAGVSTEFGGSGAERVGAEDTTAFTPTFYFGKGFGDLPESVSWARPFAVTGLLGYSMPVRAHSKDGDPNPNALVGGLTLQYSLPYLTSQIHDEGWPRWINQMTPLVEIAFEDPIRHSGGERTTGTVNPGVLWTGRHMQIGAEAIIPMNGDSGGSIGWAIQAHFFLDDLFSHSIGRPIFGGRS
ncbi:MAG: hypothetical protein GC155_16770 [Alphaproteobacteria bacterium]|nr:hypothetical protein [Alphaproteobacteria bacterium]